MFKSLKAAFGVGGPKVDTMIETPQASPGGELAGVVRIQGGDDAREVNRVTVALTAAVEVESGDEEHQTVMTVCEAELAGRGEIPAGATQELPFRLAVPWEAPFNTLRGQAFRGMRLGVQTRLDLPGGIDARDFDAVEIVPLPVHEQAIAAVEQLGFRLRGADLERGSVAGSSLGFYNEIEFQGSGRVPELELTFVSGPSETRILVEAERRGLLSSSDRHNVVVVPTAGAIDWQGTLGARIEQLGSGGGLLG